MRDINLLVWLSQLGLTVAAPPILFILLAVWLRNSYGWGAWVIWVAIGLGIYCAITSLVSALKALSKMTGEKKQDTKIVFNDHQ